MRFSLYPRFFLSSRARVNKAYIQTHRSSSSSSLCKLPPRVSERRPRLGSTRLWRIFEWDHRLCLPTFASEFVLKTSPHRSLLPLPQFVEIVVGVGVVSVLVLVVVARQKPPFPNIRRKGRPSFLRSCYYSCWLISSCTSSLSSPLSSQQPPRRNLLFVAVPFLKRSFEAFWQGRRKFKKKRAHYRLSVRGREGTKKFRKSSSSTAGQKFFLPMAERSKNTRRDTTLLPAHTNNTHAEERERERERGSTFSERKMSATPSALKASSQEENAEEENVLVSRDDDDEEEGEEREEREERERGASVGKEEEQEECVVFFFSLVIYF